MAALGERGNPEIGGRRHADEIERAGNRAAGDRLQLRERIGIAGIDRGRGTLRPCALELCRIDIAGNDIAHAARAKHRNRGHAQTAAAEHDHPVTGDQLGQLGDRAEGGQARAGQRGRPAFVDIAGIDQVARIRHQHMGGIGTGLHDTQKLVVEAVIVVTRQADRAGATTDPGINQAPVADLHIFYIGTDLFDHAIRLVTAGERRHAAAIFYIEALAATEVEIALPDVQIGVTHP